MILFVQTSAMCSTNNYISVKLKNGIKDGHVAEAKRAAMTWSKTYGALVEGNKLHMSFGVKKVSQF